MAKKASKKPVAKKAAKKTSKRTRSQGAQSEGVDFVALRNDLEMAVAYLETLPQSPKVLAAIAAIEAVFPTIPCQQNQAPILP